LELGLGLGLGVRVGVRVRDRDGVMGGVRVRAARVMFRLRPR